MGIQFNVIMTFYTKASDLPDRPLRKRNEKFVIEPLKAKSGGFEKIVSTASSDCSVNYS